MENIGTAVANLIILIFVIATIVGIINGIRESKKAVNDIRKGMRVEEIKEKIKKENIEKEEKEKEKFKSVFYRITHPLDYGNMLLIDKINEKIHGRR